MTTATIAVYNYLVQCAAASSETTYEEVALATGLPSSGNALGTTLSPILGNIFRWCKENRLPHLTSIIVRKSGKDKGLPGAGFWELLGVDVNTPRPDKKAMLYVMQAQAFTMYIGLDV